MKSHNSPNACRFQFQYICTQQELFMSSYDTAAAPRQCIIESSDEYIYIYARLSRLLRALNTPVRAGASGFCSTHKNSLPILIGKMK